MNNLSKILEEFTKKYEIKIYMFENFVFMIYLKEDIIIIPDIQIFKNSCKNPMLEDTQIINLEEAQEFALNYYNLLLSKNFFINQQNNDKFDSFYLFDFKSRINYILDLYAKLNGKGDDDTKNCYVEILSVKNEFNTYYDTLPEDFINSFKYKNIIFVRKTEFGHNYEENTLKLIIKYLFNINNLIIKNKISKKSNQLYILNKNIKYNNYILIKIIENNHILPILRQNNLEINPNIIPLIEYSYFLSLPLLIKKNDNKPNILILANDFGILNYYYTKLYPNALNISSFMENKKFIINNEKILTIEYDKIKISEFLSVIHHFKNKKDSNKFSLILLEFFRKKNKDDEAIPKCDILLKFINLLENDGILAFNLRADFFDNYNNILSSLKKKYKKVLDINFRICSGLIICCANNNIKLENYYVSISNTFIDLTNFKNEINKILSEESI